METMMKLVIFFHCIWLSKAFYTTDPRIRKAVRSRQRSSYFPTSDRSLSEASTKTIAKYATLDVVQGSSLQIFQFPQSRNDRRLRIDLVTDGRPLEALAELWQGPHNIPQKVRVYSENGRERPLRAVMETPMQKDLSCCVKNIGSMEFPLGATVKDASQLADEADVNPFFYSDLLQADKGRIIQGGAIRTFRFEPFVQRAKIVLETEGLPLCARIEISQGPNNNKQVFDIYSENGEQYPFSLAVEMPGGTNVMRILNAATVEYPMYAWVESYVDQTRGRTERMERPQNSASRRSNGSSRYNKRDRVQEQRNGSNVKLPFPKLRVPTVNDSKFFPTW